MASLSRTALLKTENFLVELNARVVHSDEPCIRDTVKG
jgi:hypothetical protein